MNAYHSLSPFANTGSTASPFANYFPTHHQNSHHHHHHSYGVISASSYAGAAAAAAATGNPRATPTTVGNHGQKSMMATPSSAAAAAAAAAAAGSSFVPSASNYFHHQSPHLQPFSSPFSTTNSMMGGGGGGGSGGGNGHQSPTGTGSPYSNHYSAYNTSPSTMTSTNASANSPSVTHNNSAAGANFDPYGSYASSTNGNGASAAATYAPYITANAPNYSGYTSQLNSVNSITANTSAGSGGGGGAYQSSSEQYLNLVGGTTTVSAGTATGAIGNGVAGTGADVVDLYSLNLHHKNDHGGLLPPIKKVKRNSGRGRNRRSQIIPSSPASPESNIDRIFIWFVDETILSCLTVSDYNNRYTGFNDTLTASLYNELFMFINKFAEKYLFLNDLKDIDQSHIDDSAADDNGQDLTGYNFQTDGFKTSVSCTTLGAAPLLNSADLRQKMALRYRKMSETYANYGDKLDELLDKSDYEQLQELTKRFDLLTKNWIHTATKALSLIKTRPNCLNVLISSSPLIYTLAKMLIFELGPHFTIGNIYSCAKTSKEHTLNRVLNRFGSTCTYIVIGKGAEEQQLSQKMELPFWPVTEKEHFESLLNAMHYFF